MILFFVFSGHIPLENVKLNSIEDFVNFLSDLKRKTDSVGNSLLMDLITSPRVREMIKKCCKLNPQERYIRFIEILQGRKDDVDNFTEIYTEERFTENLPLQLASKSIWTSHGDQMPFETFLSNFYNYYKIETEKEEWKNELVHKIMHIENVQKSEIPTINLKYVWRFYNLFGDFLKPGNDPFKKLRDIIFGQDWYFGDIEDNFSSQLLSMAVAKKKKNYFLVRQGIGNLDSFTVAICLYNEPEDVKKLSILDLKQLLDQVKQLVSKKFHPIKYPSRDYNFLKQEKKKKAPPQRFKIRKELELNFMFKLQNKCNE